MRPNKIKKIDESKPGSPQAGEPGFLAIGLLGKPHGITGEINLRINPDHWKRIYSLKSVFIGSSKKEYSIRSIRRKGENLLISFEEILTRESVAQLRNQIVYVHVMDIPVLQDDSYYYHQLIGMQVVDRQGQSIGKISEILKTGANDVYVVASQLFPQKEILIPAIKSVIVKIDIAKKRMVVNSQEWD